VRGWDAAARIHAGLAAANALALGAVADGQLRSLAWAGAAAGAGLLLRSFRSPARGDAVRFPREGVLLGRGFEWTVAAAEETLEAGRPPERPEEDLVLPEELLGRHALVFGTTGAGKTRLLELLALQAVARGDAVVVVDPKGDEGLERRLREAAGDRFRLFSLPHPERSVSYNPLGRFRDVREVADRIAALLPSAGDALPFRNFAWEIVHTAARELLSRKQAITLRSLKRAAIDRPAGALAERPRDHHLKLASALLPPLSKLGLPRLSPDSGGLAWEEVDRGRLAVYFSLGSLIAGETASAVAKMTLIDLVGFVGDRYARSKGNGPVWLFVDELADVATPEFVSLLSKSRGAGLRVVAAGQTPADLETALGSAARARQALASVNTVVQFRAPAAPDAEAFSELCGRRLLRTRSEGAAYEPALLGSGLRTVDDFRARFAETVQWGDQPFVPAWALLDLPVFGFFARTDGRVLRGRVPPPGS
jgi:conjugal transfer pilus assembly protein TraD